MKFFKAFILALVVLSVCTQDQVEVVVVDEVGVRVQDQVEVGVQGEVGVGVEDEVGVGVEDEVRVEVVAYQPVYDDDVADFATEGNLSASLSSRTTAPTDIDVILRGASIEVPDFDPTKFEQGSFVPSIQDAQRTANAVADAIKTESTNTVQNLFEGFLGSAGEEGSQQQIAEPIEVTPIVATVSEPTVVVAEPTASVTEATMSESSASPLGRPIGPLVIPIDAQPRVQATSQYFFTPDFFYGLTEEASSVSSLIELIRGDIQRIGYISEKEYDSFNRRWSVRGTPCQIRSYDYITVDYRHATDEVVRLLNQTIGVNLPKADLNSLLTDVLYCGRNNQAKQILKVFKISPPSVEDKSVLRSQMGILVGTCRLNSIDLFAYSSGVDVQARSDLSDVDSEVIQSDRSILERWLVLNFAAGFN